jgi:hypothetical protein
MLCNAIFNMRIKPYLPNRVFFFEIKIEFLREGIVGIRMEEVLRGLGGWSGFTQFL